MGLIKISIGILILKIQLIFTPFVGNFTPLSPGINSDINWILLLKYVNNFWVLGGDWVVDLGLAEVVYWVVDPRVGRFL